MNSFYLTFTWRRKSIGMFDTLTDMASWKVRRTELDLDKESDLVKFIAEMEPEYPGFMLTFWKRLS